MKVNLEQTLEFRYEKRRRTVGVDPVLWIIPLVLNAFGILMIFSLTSHTALEEFGSPFALGMRQVQWLLLSILSMIAVYLIPISKWREYSGVLWVVSLVLLVLTLIPGLGIKAGGARRWIGLGGLRFQPIELLSLAVAVHLSKILTKSPKGGMKAFFSLTAPVLGFSAVPLIFQPNMGGIILIFALTMAIHVETRGWSWPILFGGAGFAFFFFIIIQAGYRLRRYMAFVDPWEEPLKSGFQVIQGMVAFANGGLLGVGIGKGLQKLNYLPAARTDYIFATIGEEFGFVGSFMILLLFFIWTIRAYLLYRSMKDPFHTALTWAVSASLLIPLFINLGGVL
ncbi:MAG: FtsW/RodA/SpoVE family cell cycle protein, partial [Synergistota bacterium]|nr:FtsW/RodA/SpoVE family cell cycle protein [Synergistota bacterium]